jgi:catalase
VPATLPSGDPDPGLIRVTQEEVDSGLERFVQAVAKHRHFERETDPPGV